MQCASLGTGLPGLNGYVPLQQVGDVVANKQQEGVSSDACTNHDNGGRDNAVRGGVHQMRSHSDAKAMPREKACNVVHAQINSKRVASSATTTDCNVGTFNDRL